jgi:hypothetical protein
MNSFMPWHEAAVSTRIENGMDSRVSFDAVAEKKFILLPGVKSWLFNLSSAHYTHLTLLVQKYYAGPWFSSPDIQNYLSPYR